MEKQVLIIMRRLLLKLVRMGKWGGAHTPLHVLTHSLPSRYATTNKGKKLVKEAIKNLINFGFLIAKPSTGEIHISLNPAKTREISLFLTKIKKEVGENGT